MSASLDHSRSRRYRARLITFSIAILLAGSLVQAQTLPCDFNADGFEDLVVAGVYGSDVLDGASAFSDGVAFSGSEIPRACLELTRDGIGDFVTTSAPDIVGENLSFYQGGFPGPEPLDPGWRFGKSSGYTFERAVVAGDFYADGFIDVAVYERLWDGRSVTPRIGVYMTDERLFLNRRVVYLEPDDPIFYAGHGPIHGSEMAELGRDMATGDFDSDGLTDLALTFEWEPFDSHHIFILYGSSEFYFDPDRALFVGSIPQRHYYNARPVLKSGDFNGDGMDDLVATAPLDSDPLEGYDPSYCNDNPACRETSAVQVWYQHEGGFEEGESFEDEELLFGFALAVGDFQNDGCDDLAIGVPTGAVSEGSTLGSVTVIYCDPALPGLSWSGSQTLRGWTHFPDDSLFGYALSAGEYNGDVYQDLVVGMPAYGDAFHHPPHDAGMIVHFPGGSSGLVAAGSPLTRDDVSSLSGSHSNEYWGRVLSSR